MDGKQGWWVVFGCVLTLSITSAVGFFTTPAYIDHMLIDLNWTLKEFTIGTSLWAVAAAIVSPLCGYLVERFGVRAVMFGGILTAAFTQYLMGSVQNLTHYYILMALTPISILACTYIPLATLVSHWFVKHRAIATGVAMLGIGVGGGIAPNMTKMMMEAHGWRGAMTDLALVLLLALIPTCIWLRSPQGHTTVQEEIELGDEEAHISLSPKEAMKTRTFWSISLSEMFLGVVLTTLNVHLLLYLEHDTGDGVLATNVQSVYFFCMGIGILLFGGLGDSFPFRRVLTSCYVLGPLSVLLLLTSDSPLALYTFAILIGLLGGGRITLIPVALANHLGAIHLAKLYGFASALYMVGSAVGPLVAAAIFDATGDTVIIYYLFMVMLVLSTIFISTIRKEKHPA